MALVFEGKVEEEYDVQHISNDLIEHILGLYQALTEILNQKGIDAETCKKPVNGFDSSKRVEVEQ